MLHGNFSLWQTSRACATKIVHTRLCYNNTSCHTHGKSWRLKKHIMPHVKRRNQQVDCSDFARLPSKRRCSFMSSSRGMLSGLRKPPEHVGQGNGRIYALSCVHPVRGKKCGKCFNPCFHRHIQAWQPQPAGPGEWIALLQNSAILHWAFIIYTYSILIFSVVIYLIKCDFDTTCSWILVQIHCKRLSFRWRRALYMPNFWPSTIKSLNVNEDLDLWQASSMCCCVCGYVCNCCIKQLYEYKNGNTTKT